MNTTDAFADVMQVCLNGHVITALLSTQPESGQSHCDRCGALTIDRCRTCGQILRSSACLLGMSTIGQPHPPEFCATCGAAHPWAYVPQAAIPADSQVQLETLLRRMPRVIRQLRVRHGDRPAHRIVDEIDLEDLLRALLPLHFDDIRPESRTPRYAAGTRTDFVLKPAGLALTLKHAGMSFQHVPLPEQVHEDVAYYGRLRFTGVVICGVYDPEGRIHEPQAMEKRCMHSCDGMEHRCVIAS